MAQMHRRVRDAARRNVRMAAGLAVVSLGIGTIGFLQAYAPCREIAAAGAPCTELGWADALLDAAMLLGGMGPVHADRLLTTWAKLFAAGYALFSGLCFLILAALMLGPVFQHGLHRFHLEVQQERQE